jgi:hypothetical protein
MMRATDNKSENDSFSSVGDLNGEHSENERDDGPPENPIHPPPMPLPLRRHPQQQRQHKQRRRLSIRQQQQRMKQSQQQQQKLKKQANAKFNKGDFTAARTLYTLGIQIMAKLDHRLGPKEAEMLSSMHSNRALTFFREKNFISCMQDCEVAIQYNPYYEKSWIRKWRALMALGTILPCCIWPHGRMRTLATWMLDWKR